MTVEKRERRLTLHLTETEYDLLTRAAGHYRRRPSDIVRQLILNWARDVQRQAQENQG